MPRLNGRCRLLGKRRYDGASKQAKMQVNGATRSGPRRTAIALHLPGSRVCNLAMGLCLPVFCLQSHAQQQQLTQWHHWLRGGNQR